MHVPWRSLSVLVLLALSVASGVTVEPWQLSLQNPSQGESEIASPLPFVIGHRGFTALYPENTMLVRVSLYAELNSWQLRAVMHEHSTAL